MWPDAWDRGPDSIQAQFQEAVEDSERWPAGDRLLKTYGCPTAK